MSLYSFHFKYSIYTTVDTVYFHITNLLHLFVVLRYRLQLRVQDESGTISLSLFNDEEQAMVGRSAYQLCDKYGCKVI